MTVKGVKRKLTAIFSADVEGYSRLMSDDEVATVNMLKEYREVMAGLIAQHSGRVVDSPGDNLLAEFASVMDAVECAAEVQREFRKRNVEVPEDRRMKFRIGVNLGDVIVEGEQIYGDGVNIAARIESLAEAGGICISGSAHEQIENKLAFGYEFLGEQSVKNIAKPVRVYRLLLEQEEGAPTIQKRKGRDRRGQRVIYTSILAVLVMAAAALTVWYLGFRSHSPPMKAASEGESRLSLPEKPSIAVMPFMNISGDPEQDYFSDGITEDIITDLSKISGLFIISRNSVFLYKGKPVKPERVGRELGVRYLLEGSVRRVGNRVRITAQLVDATTGGQLWAERYDGTMRDVFALQDEVTQKIVSAMEVNLTQSERERLASRYTSNVEAYDYYLRGLEHYKRATKDSNEQARAMYERAIATDPEFALAYVGLGATFFQEWTMLWSQDPRTLDKALELGRKAIAMDGSLSGAHVMLGRVYLWKKDYERAIAEHKRAIALDPNDAEGYAELGETLIWAGRPEEAPELLQRAMRLNPHYPVHYLAHVGFSHYLARRYEEAITVHERVLALDPDFWGSYLFLAVIYGEMGQLEKARAEYEKARKLFPQLSLEMWQEKLPFKNPEHLARLMDSLRNAGLD
jgi:adenylate cyclase